MAFVCTGRQPVAVYQCVFLCFIIKKNNAEQMMKTITVPLSMEAMKRLNFDCNIAGDLIELDISPQFYKLFTNGFFSEINQKLNIIIDDYEDEKILGLDNLERLASIVMNYFLRFKDEIYLKIHALVMEAIQKNTGVFFLLLNEQT